MVLWRLLNENYFFNQQFLIEPLHLTAEFASPRKTLKVEVSFGASQELFALALPANELTVC